MDSVLTLKEACKVCRICRATMWNLISNGRGPRALRTPGGGKMLFLRSDLDAWLNGLEFVPTKKRAG